MLHQFQKWNVSGGYANQLENLNKIDDVIATLKEAKDGGANVTGAIGAVPKFIRSDLQIQHLLQLRMI